MNYACPVWRSAALSNIKKMQVLQSKCFCVATNGPWCIGNRQSTGDLGVPYFSDHITFVTERFDSKLAELGNALFEQLGRHLRGPSVGLRPLIRGNQNRLVSWVPPMWPRTHQTVPTGTFSATLAVGFPSFSRVVGNASV